MRPINSTKHMSTNQLNSTSSNDPPRFGPLHNDLWPDMVLVTTEAQAALRLLMPTNTTPKDKKHIINELKTYGEEVTITITNCHVVPQVVGLTGRIINQRWLETDDGPKYLVFFGKNHNHNQDTDHGLVLHMDRHQFYYADEKEER